MVVKVYGTLTKNNFDISRHKLRTSIKKLHRVSNLKIVLCSGNFISYSRIKSVILRCTIVP